jgi:hypothetical protein
MKLRLLDLVVLLRDLPSTFLAAECTQSDTKILCETADRSSTLQIKRKSAALGRVSFILKMKTGVGAPASFVGPLSLYLSEVATWANREGAAALCSTTPTKIVCR